EYPAAMGPFSPHRPARARAGMRWPGAGSAGMTWPGAVVVMFMKVEIWSDVVCPRWYIGKRNFEEALARFDHRGEVEVVWRSFELDPGAARRREGEYAERLARKYGVGRREAQAMVDRMTSRAAEAGLTFRFG